MIPEWALLTREERQQAIAKHAADGLSAGQIALQFTGVSRNAIIGYCKRSDIKLKNARGGSRSAMARPAPRTEAATRPAKPAKPDLVALGPISRSKAFEPLAGRVPVHLADLKSFQCHWPVNALEGSEPIFCGASASSLYCTSHARLAYLPRGQRGAQ